MTVSKGHALIVDDDQDTCEMLEMALVRQGYQVTTTTDAQRALELVALHAPDVLLTDLAMPEMSGLVLCGRAHELCPDLPVIVVTGSGSLDSAVGAIRVGAYDFLEKPVDAKVLVTTVARAIQHHHLRKELKSLRAKVAENAEVQHQVLGASAAMRRVYELIGRVGESDASVLIHGETGTGKELTARAIHARSHRANGPFVAINCAAVPHSLIESELFGHARGAFTDAKVDRKGLFVQASGGTLFLDEIGELPLEMQPKLLRALQERKVRPVGSNVEIPFDARILAASNRNLEDEVHERRFREDLYYRINVVKIDVPPLRDRGGDVLQLASFFLRTFAERSAKQGLRLSATAAEKLVAYHWPGNVRELENCMEHAVALARFDQLTVEDLPEKLRGYHAERVVASANEEAELLTMDELEHRYILRVLSLVRGNKSRAATVLGFDRRTLYRKLERFDEVSGAPAPGLADTEPPPAPEPAPERESGRWSAAS